ncbi:MAG TPA: hypothetical protein VGK04_08365, partial [Thermoanaerobaculia bacterium]
KAGGRRFRGNAQSVTEVWTLAALWLGLALLATLLAIWFRISTALSERSRRRPDHSAPARGAHARPWAAIEVRSRPSLLRRFAFPCAPSTADGGGRNRNRFDRPDYLRRHHS